jgi:hypothetical protein
MRQSVYKVELVRLSETVEIIKVMAEGGEYLRCVRVFIK